MVVGFSDTNLPPHGAGGKLKSGYNRKACRVVHQSAGDARWQWEIFALFANAFLQVLHNVQNGAPSIFDVSE
jgi:hypothetical protein